MEAKKYRVAFVYQFWPHYRQGFIEELNKSTLIDATLYGDTVDRRPTSPISIASIPVGLKHKKTRTFYITKGLMWQTGLLKLAIFGRYDGIVFLGNPRYPATALACFTAKLFQKRVLMWTHGWRSYPRGGRRLLANIFYGMADALLLYSDRAKQIGTELGFNRERLFVIYNSLDISKQTSLLHSSQALVGAGASFSSSNAELNLLFVGRLIPDKKLHLMVPILQELVRRDVQVKLSIIGDGSEARPLRELFAFNQLPVKFFGSVHDEVELSRHFLNATASICPGAAGLLVIHSAAYGTPVITHSNMSKQGPEVEFMLNNPLAGLLVEEDSVSQFVEAILSLPRVHDYPARVTLANKLASRYSPIAQVNVIVEALEAVGSRIGDTG